MNSLDVAFSTCPNDTFIFYAMLNACIDTRGLTFSAHLHDVEELNVRAFSQAFHISKLSVYAYFQLKAHYELLDAGAALGYGCGPMLVGRPGEAFTPKARIAVPGRYTTAYLLLRLWNPGIENVAFTRFDYILEGVQSGEYDFGLIIHEGRFVYPGYGCVQVVDLGQWWQEETGLPIPLGCIASCKDPSTSRVKNDIESVLRQSVIHARENPDASLPFIRTHVQEMDDKVINDHIELYVNDFTVSLGETGRQAMQRLEEMARWENVL